MSVISKSIPYSWAGTATEFYKAMFSCSEVAKNFICGRHKFSYVISDRIGLYSQAEVINEPCRPGVFCSVLIDETQRPEQRLKQRLFRHDTSRKVSSSLLWSISCHLFLVGPQETS